MSKYFISRQFLETTNYFASIKTSLQLLEVSSEIKNLSKIIKACRLQSSSLLKTGNLLSSQFIEDWHDEFNCSFKINKSDKSIEIKLNNLDKNVIYNYDIYSGLSLKNVTKISKSIYLFVGQDDGEIISYISFLGIDDYLRSYFYDGIWKRCSSLIMGMDLLKVMFERHENFKKLPSNYNIDVGCETGRSWLCLLPASTRLVDELKNVHGVDFSFLFNELV
jgi:hypothetical protein